MEYLTHLGDVFEVNGSIEIGDVLNAGLDHQIFLAGMGKGAERHNSLRGPLVITTPSTSSTPSEPSSSSAPTPITTSEPTASTTPPKAHVCVFCKKRHFEAWGSEKLGKYQRSRCLNPTLKALTDENYISDVGSDMHIAHYKLPFQRYQDMKFWQQMPV